MILGCISIYLITFIVWLIYIGPPFIRFYYDSLMIHGTCMIEEKLYIIVLFYIIDASVLLYWPALYPAIIIYDKMNGGMGEKNMRFIDRVNNAFHPTVEKAFFYKFFN